MSYISEIRPLVGNRPLLIPGGRAIVRDGMPIPDLPPLRPNVASSITALQQFEVTARFQLF